VVPLPLQPGTLYRKFEFGEFAMRALALIVAVAAIWSSAILAKARYVAYDGLDSISEGRGGTKIVAHDVDFWTTGQPPRRFQVLGILTDKRCNSCSFSGEAVGSRSIAKQVKEVGGDAVIILDQNSRITGYVHGGQANVNGNTAYGSGWTAPVEEATTRMVVVKYLLSEPASPAQAPAPPSP
jgi:hypothetical protein